MRARQAGPVCGGGGLPPRACAAHRAGRGHRQPAPARRPPLHGPQAPAHHRRRLLRGARWGVASLLGWAPGSVSRRRLAFVAGGDGRAHWLLVFSMTHGRWQSRWQDLWVFGPGCSPACLVQVLVFVSKSCKQIKSVSCAGELLRVMILARHASTIFSCMS